MNASKIPSSAVITGAILILLLWGSAWPQTAASSEEVKKSAPRVYIESAVVNPAVFQKEIAFINHVSNASQAQVIVTITIARVEIGEAYTLTLTGLSEFAGVNDALTYRVPPGQKTEDTEKELVRFLKLGLLRYVSKTPIGARISVAFLDQVRPTAVIDPWNFWVFSFAANGFLNGESSYRNQMWYGSMSASRMTPEWKIRFSAGGSYSHDSFSIPGYTYESDANSRYFSGMIVRSIDDHWSVGGIYQASSSTYNNLKFSLLPAAALEYDVYPYSQSTKKQLRILYSLGFQAVWYREETIYNKTTEALVGESLSATLELVQPWGTISTSLEGSHYFHDFSKNKLALNGEISLRLFKGFNFNISGGGSRIHDQLFLPKEGASLEEILLRRRQLETTYNYFFMVGFSYTFGSIFNKTVNPRFGSGSGGISMSISM
jgi:hypothetical protein